MGLNILTGGGQGPGVPGGPGNGGNNPNLPGGIGPGGQPNTNDDDTRDLAISLLTDLNATCKDAEPTLFRDAVVQQTLGVLITMKKPNAVLIGPAGVGKTKIAEEIARRLANDDPLIPPALRGYTIYQFSVADAIDGANLIGQLEEHINSILLFAQDPKEKVILFIDELHQLFQASDPIYRKVAQIFKPAMARGKMHVIGATTTQEARNMKDDPAFARRFTKIIVDELTKEQTTQILLNMKPMFIQHHNRGALINLQQVQVDDALIPLITELAEQYKMPGSHRPDNAITLFDRTIAQAVINRHVLIKNAMEQPQPDPNNIAMLQQMPIIIGESHIRKTANLIATGNSKPEIVDFLQLAKIFEDEIKGQDVAVAKIMKYLKRNDKKYFTSAAPLAMMFVGPSGVGKTAVSKILAQNLTGCQPIMLNMTEYNDSATINRIIGSPAGYVGSESNSELPFDKLESNPYQVIILDEFEKAHISVQRLFMGVLEEGKLETNRGTTVDFSRAIIIVTTNAGHQTIQKQLGFNAGAKETTLEDTIQNLKHTFEPALIGRFKHRIMSFQPISTETYKTILQAKYHAKRDIVLAKNPSLQLPDDIPDNDLDRITRETYVPDTGARPAEEAVEEYIYDLDP